MTDNEIIKAFEEHIERTKNIKYGARKMAMVDVELLKNALDLINRQQETIKTLRNCVEQYHIIRKDGKSPLSLLTEEIKADAIKEFAERLKPKLSAYDEVYVDSLVKEMVGEE